MGYMSQEEILGSVRCAKKSRLCGGPFLDQVFLISAHGGGGLLE